jgi:hypothetical protein
MSFAILIASCLVSITIKFSFASDCGTSEFSGVLFFFMMSFTTSGLYYKHMAIVNDDSSIVKKLEALLTEDARGVIYDRRLFIVQATGSK